MGKTRIDFGRPRKPTDTCDVGTFNGSPRDECLNVNWFSAVKDAKEIFEAWRRDYKGARPHSALKNAAPEEYVRRFFKLDAENLPSK